MLEIISDFLCNMRINLVKYVYSSIIPIQGSINTEMRTTNSRHHTLLQCCTIIVVIIELGGLEIGFTKFRSLKREYK